MNTANLIALESGLDPGATSAVLAFDKEQADKYAAFTAGHTVSALSAVPVGPHALIGKRLSEIALEDLEPVIVIAHFDDALGPVPQNPAVHFQITLQSGRCSPSGDFYAFDGASGDQIHGWQRCDRIMVDDVIGSPTQQAEAA